MENNIQFPEELEKFFKHIWKFFEDDKPETPTESLNFETLTTESLKSIQISKDVVYNFTDEEYLQFAENITKGIISLQKNGYVYMFLCTDKNLRKYLMIPRLLKDLKSKGFCIKELQNCWYESEEIYEISW